ncbi:c-type cytochrome [Hyphomicrobium sp.]|uniref:c-type cytochrome n=1 Tax=Hyphomicrobium sp. TaxID=82 RepID=UPI003F703B00
MRRIVLAVAAAAIGATAVIAQNVGVIDERQKLLKDMSKTTKPVGAMFKGEAEFDLAKVQAALKAIQETAPRLPPLFPDNSKTGGDTEALPVIWDEKADFEDRFKKLADAAKAAEATITDEATFPDTWKQVMGNCSGCHKKYRKPKS